MFGWMAAMNIFLTNNSQVLSTYVSTKVTFKSLRLTVTKYSNSQGVQDRSAVPRFVPFGSTTIAYGCYVSVASESFF